MRVATLLSGSKNMYEAACDQRRCDALIELSRLKKQRGKSSPLCYPYKVKWLAGIVERCTANPIQIVTVIEYPLREYYSQVRGRHEDVIEVLGLPYDFAQRCPLCGAKDCAPVSYTH